MKIPWMKIPPPFWVPVTLSDHPFTVKRCLFNESEFLLLQLALVASHLFAEHPKGKSVSLSSVDPPIRKLQIAMRSPLNLLTFSSAG